jgi:protein O-mannosyl-transferase
MRKAEAGQRDSARSLGPWAAGPAVVCLLLAAAIALVYAPVARFDFVSWDDPWYVSKNPHVLGGLGWSALQWAFTTGGDFYWHPLTWLSHQLDASLFGTNAGGHHVVSVVLHAAATLLLFAFLRRVSGVTWRSALVAALFGLHPLRVESVAWVAERKDVLSGVFWMLTMAAYAFHARHPGWRRYLLVAVAFGAGLMAKPTIVTLPIVLLLLDIWPLGRWTPAGGLATSLRPQATGQSFLVEKLPLLAMSAVVAVATVVFQARAGAVGGLGVLPLAYRVSNALVSYVAYVGMTIWPVNLAAFYPYPPDLPAWWKVMGAAALLAGALVAAVRSIRARPYVTVGVLWYLVALLPVSGLIQAGDQLMADRFTYLPSIGILVVLVWGGAELLARWRVPQWAAAAMAGVLVLACAAASHAQVGYWRNSETLWTRALAVTDGNHRAHAGLAEWLADHGNVTEATKHYQEAVRLAPAGADYRHALGMALVKQGRADEGARELAEAVRLNPRLAEARVSLGAVLVREGRSREAADQYTEALRLRPDMPQALAGLGSALVQEGRFQEAVRACADASRLDRVPFDGRAAFDGRMCAGLAFARLGRPIDAAAEFFGATELNPSSEAAWVNLGIAFTQGPVDRKADAIAAFEKALQIDPENARVRMALEELRRR